MVPKFQSYSIASCVVETGYRLRAQPGQDGASEELRAVGRALLTAEVLSYRQLPLKHKKSGTQGLQISLGFYDSEQLVLVLKATRTVEDELALSVGGFAGGFEIDLMMLDDDKEWLGVGQAWPDRTEHRHLDRRFNTSLQLWGNKGPLQFGQSKILARRIRYRFGIDFAQKEKSAPTDALFWWSTPQTESWIAKTYTGSEIELDSYIKKQFNYKVNDWMKNLAGAGFPNVDPVTLGADDWGLIDLVRDPIRVRFVGPKSTKAATHSDVKKTLSKAGKQIEVEEHRCSSSEDEFALVPITHELTKIAAQQRDGDFCDVVIVYRGGGLREDTVELRHEHARRKNAGKLYGLIDDKTRRGLVQAIESLVALGIEVVIGIGHGDEGIYESLNMAPPVGVHEAVTPTAAAAWVLREHVNHRMVDSVVDLGQSG